MDLSDQNPTTPVSADPSQAFQLLRTLFDKHDLVLFRPIETWTEGGRRRSRVDCRVDYRNDCYRLALATVLTDALDRLLASSNDERGRPTLFAGTHYDIGDRAIMVLVDGKPVLDVRESCLFAAFPETDARAFATLYERMAVQARNAFTE